MENPCLTFATPTLLAGDRSLADVIAHEIAHSWTGNLVTNHTWAHFWLNEGWTVWLERKIASRLKGVEHGKLSAQVAFLLALGKKYVFLDLTHHDSSPTSL
jgi:leukotriene-A4 hydrolase